MKFTHLHLHTRYSVLDGACSIPKLMKKAASLGMEAIAITDHGNMFGVMEFVQEAKKNNIKPIVGCEFYVADKSRFNKTGKEDRSGYHLILLAKNEVGYHNLCKLSNYSYKKEAFYYKPRIDHELLEKHHEGLICCSACIAGELPQAILHGKPEDAEEVIKFFKNLFQDDYYLEFQNHGHSEQEIVNKKLQEIAFYHNIKCIASNDVHFIEKSDYEAHKILICLNTGRKLKEYENSSLSYTGQEYLKTAEEMLELFPEHPEYLQNTQEVVDKVESFSLEHEILLPKFPLPEGFATEMDYLRYLTYEGGKKRYGEEVNDAAIKERLDFELATIEKMGFPGYFLIVWDFIRAARDMGVLVGPGRGSAAGSAIAYCLGITNIDPIKYNLLFERFLNPGRISMPDIDIDFDDIGREKVIKYVIEKYGEERVAQIITYGSMASKSAIKDVARVLDLPLPESNRLAKMIPDKDVKSLYNALDRDSNLPKEKRTPVKEFIEEYQNTANPLIKQTIDLAVELEGSIRSTGTHACGMIIAPEDLDNYVPLSMAKDSDMPVTQYEGQYVESCGLLKMDFLGLKTLSIIKNALSQIKQRAGIDIDIDQIPLDDEETYELFGRGDTNGVFQFESEGMKKYLRELKPTNLEDLIAMNALYRPGPMEKIPDFIARKDGRKPIEYDLEGMDEFLKDTYGITVYQEQVMLLSQKLANFTKSDADNLRKAMGKKKLDVLEKMKALFDEGTAKNGHSKEICDKIWEEWKAFASYAFNKSHATCYAYVAYQTAYLKAHYPSEYMSAVLTSNLSNIEEISFLLAESKSMGINVLGPDINESQEVFSVNANGDIRFGLGAIKNVGEKLVSEIIEERNKNGKFKDVMDFVSRNSQKNLNKRCMEALAKSGAFDCFGISRATFVEPCFADGSTFTDQLIKSAASSQGELNQESLFGAEESGKQEEIHIPEVAPWSLIEKANNEKEVVGIYLSGHPMDNYKIETKQIATHTVEQLNSLDKSWIGRSIRFAFAITKFSANTTKTGSEWGKLKIEDSTGSYEWALFGRKYLEFKHLFEAGRFLMAQAEIKTKFNGELEISPSKIMLLEEVLEIYTKSISIRLQLEEINQDFVSGLEQVVEKSKKKSGGVELVLWVESRELNLALKMPLKKNRLDAAVFMKELEESHLLNMEQVKLHI